MGKSLPGIVPISVFGALLLPAACLAQRYTFKQFGQAEGLSNLNVNVLLQARAGFLWAGTENGLFRYDGLRFQSVSLGSEILAGSVLALHEDAAGRLWVGRQNGVGYLEEGTFHVVRFHNANLRLFPGNTISSSPDGSVFIASDGDLLAGNQSQPSGEWSFRKLPVQLKVNSVLAGPGSPLIVGCGDGICRLKGSQLQRWGEKDGLKKDTWQSLYLSSRGELWAWGNQHIAALPQGAATFPGSRHSGNTQSRFDKRDYRGSARKNCHLQRHAIDALGKRNIGIYSTSGRACLRMASGRYLSIPMARSGSHWLVTA